MDVSGRKTLWIIRGLAGSGKSTLAEHILRSVYLKKTGDSVFSADDYFTDEDGTYTFDKTKLSKAHEQCLRNVHRQMVNEIPDIVVNNTFSTKWEVEPYIQACSMHEYIPFVIECQNDFGSVHNVPPEVRVNMEARWENFHITQRQGDV